MFRGISLANKCLLLFGAALVLIILAALAVPWFRLSALVRDDGIEASRQMVRVWEAMRAGDPGPDQPGAPTEVAGGQIMHVPGDQVGAVRRDNSFAGQAWDRFLEEPTRSEHTSTGWSGLLRQYRYARAIRDDRGQLTGMVVLERQSNAAVRDMLANTVYLASAGLVALGLAVLAFYLITTHLILSPVRSLRDTADQVRQGNLQIRSEIQTGDEFEELAGTFNAMLGALQETQKSLRAINTELDKRVDALAQQNLALNEANKLKGDFLASVSHELRTPLNSILGFAELLQEVAQKEVEAGDDSTRLQKRRRYLDNIIAAGRTLLDLINGLLEMAKIEAGKVELDVQRIDLHQAAEGLLALMRPVADKRGVELRLEAPEGPVEIESDPRKLQQIVFNFLSNAIKFTGEAGEKRDPDPADGPAPPPDDENGEAPSRVLPRRGIVTLRIEPLLVRRAEGESEERVRISVLDTGPGIAPEHLQTIFDKFTQISGGHTRRHGGTGLGLSISKELTALLQGEIQVQSEVSQGSMFSIILPQRIDPERARESKLEAQFRGALAGRAGPE